MTIDTQKLRGLIRKACPLPWMIATSNSWRRIVRTGRYQEVCVPTVQPTDNQPDLWFDGGLEGPNARLLIESVNALPELLDIIDAANGQVAEYARMMTELRSELEARINAQTAELETSRRVLAGLPDGAIDGGWTFRGIEAYAKNLEVEIAKAKGQIEYLDRQNIALREDQTWEPIETGPKDGTEVLCWRSDCGPFIASYTSLSELVHGEIEVDAVQDLFDEDWFTQWPQALRLKGSEAPTHWMPLPAPPTAQEQGESE